MTLFSLLDDLLDLSAALEEDRAVDLEDRRHRDRSIGQRLQQYRNKSVTQIRAWLHEISPARMRKYGPRGARLYHVLCLVLLASGFITGWGLAGAALFYDGRQPINIVNAVAVLLLPQGLLLLAWILSALPLRLPLFRNLAATLGFLNPGRLAAQLAGSFTNEGQQGLSMLWNPDNAAILAPAARWLFSFWSQLFAFSFNIGILSSTFFLVSSSDLAFVWSSTLTIGDETFHYWLTVFSTPWSSLFPNAIPSADLVANSRYFRLDEGTLAGAAATPKLAGELGQWWPFLIAAIACYGLLPRLVTLGISWFRFRQHLGRALCNLPGAPELLARMNSPLVSTLAAEPEHALTITTDDAAARHGEGHYALHCPVIDWAGTCSDEKKLTKPLAAMGIKVQDFLPAGGRQTTEADEALIASLCRGRPEGVGILVRAWEPPILDFLDFLRGMRSQCGGKKPIIVLLMGGTDGVNSADRETWQLTLGQLRDPDLHVEIISESA